MPAPLIRSVTGTGTRSKTPPNAYFCRSAALIFRFRTGNAHGSAPSSMIIAVRLPAPWAPRVRRGVRLGCQWMMTKPSAVATAVGNPHTGMPAFDAAGLLGRLAALVEDLPGEVAAALPAGSVGPDDERVAARVDGDGGVLARSPANGWHNHLAARFVRNLKARG